LTKKIENLHFKILFSQAFRAPSIENINIAVGGTIKPERSNVFEAELGYQFTPETVFSVNAFSLSTNDVIIYQSETISATETIEYYKNFDRSGTHGLEAQYSLRKKKWYLNASYSFSRANSNNTVETYRVPQTSNVFVGFPASKVTLNSSFQLVDKLHFSPSLIYASKRYAYNAIDGDGNYVSNQLDPYVLLNAFFNYKNIVEGLTMGAGIYDLLNQRPAIPQAYNGGYAPISGRSREYVFRLTYQLNFKKN
jgi:outer membrane receptor protein involved in Fe transport